MRRLLFAAAILCSVTPNTRPVSACLNDTAINTDEKEFRSQYGQTGKAEPAATAGWHGVNPWALAALAVGSGLIGGSGLVLWRRRSSQDSTSPGAV